MKEIVLKYLDELSNGLPKETADSNLLRVLELQQKRLADEGLEMIVKATPQGFIPEANNSHYWKDTHYKTNVVNTTAKYTRTFFKKGNSKPIFRFEDDYIMYFNVTECLDYNVSANDTYICPNCGTANLLHAISSDGCSSCGAQFKMSELYPRISGGYRDKDIGENVKQSLLPTILTVMIIAIIIGIIAGIAGGYSFWGVFGRAVIAAITGFIAGYMLVFFKVMKSLLSGVNRSVKRSAFNDSPKMFAENMRKYSEEFSYEYFTNKVISLLEAILYSSHDEELPFYSGEETVQFDHIIDAEFTGALQLKSFDVCDDVVSAEVVAFMENLYHSNGIISKKNEALRVTLKRDFSSPINYFFNIRSVHCPSCATSFDALTNQVCPSCGNKLNMMKEDWVITKCEKV